MNELMKQTDLIYLLSLMLQPRHDFILFFFFFWYKAFPQNFIVIFIISIFRYRKTTQKKRLNDDFIIK